MCVRVKLTFLIHTPTLSLIQTHTHTDKYTPTFTRIHTHTNTHAHEYTRTRIHTHTNTHAHEYTRTRIHTHTNTHSHRPFSRKTHANFMYYIQGTFLTNISFFLERNGNLNLELTGVWGGSVCV
jgi:hypothetical protein